MCHCRLTERQAVALAKTAGALQRCFVFLGVTQSISRRDQVNLVLNLKPKYREGCLQVMPEQMMFTGSQHWFVSAFVVSLLHKKCSFPPGVCVCV